VTTATAVEISFELGCVYATEAFPLLRQLQDGNYDACSVLEIPPTFQEWLSTHRTARKRVNRAGARGYVCAPLSRENYEDEIHAINTSARARQGRPMSAGYRRRQTFSPLPDYPCARHATRVTGIWDPELRLVGYLVMLRAGELALVSQILGHADELEHEIMYLLFATALQREIDAGPGLCVYNRHDSGTDGLRFFKERLGFEETAVEWTP
jgi:hypothetical protein